MNPFPHRDLSSQLDNTVMVFTTKQNKLVGIQASEFVNVNKLHTRHTSQFKQNRRVFPIGISQRVALGRLMASQEVDSLIHERLKWNHVNLVPLGFHIHLFLTAFRRYSRIPCAILHSWGLS